MSILTGDALEHMRALDADSFDAMLTDPPYGLEFMGRDWDKVVPGVDVWAEALRVLKPGAFALVFGGTRTFHRLAVALEDAGFEVRDTLMWVYGSGFPKSHDVSKAIDKAAGAEREVVGERIYADGHVRRSAESIGYQGSNPESDRRDITAPATPDAARWQGYGTALKPAWESIILAQKPASLPQLCGILAHKIGEAICRLPAYARDAERPSTCNPSEWQAAAAPGSAQWSAVERCSTLADLSEAMAMSPSASGMPTSLSIALSWLDTLAAISSHASTFTTETASSLTTDLRTLKSSPWLTTPEGIMAAAITPPGTESNASLAASIFTAAKAKLLLTLTPSAREPVTSKDDALALRPDWEPILLVRKPTPLTFAENALEHGTGALNIDGARVPFHGEGDEAESKTKNRHGDFGSGARDNRVYGGDTRSRAEQGNYDPPGRWPANVLHDGSAEVVDLFPTTTARGHTPARRGAGGISTDGHRGHATTEAHFDTGSAARFFYCAKASTSERNAGLDHLPPAESEATYGSVQDGRPHTSEDYRYSRPARRNPHPTVKPIALTEYLARLLLPPPRDTPRRILIPFAGSGSEVIGAMLAGWDAAVGIEREPEYVRVAEARIAHHTTGARRDPTGNSSVAPAMQPPLFDAA